MSRIYPRPDRPAFDTAAVVIQLMGVLPKRNKEKEGPTIRPCRKPPYCLYVVTELKLLYKTIFGKCL